MLGHVAIVLHAHLPYVRHPEHPRSLEERWLHEALWECYLPLLDVLDRLVRDAIDFALTISISPPLAAMLKDELLCSRFEKHLARLEALVAREHDRLAGDRALAPVVALYQDRLARCRARWDTIHGDVVGALVAHADAGRVELWTTSASHAYLPGLKSPDAVRAQLRLGLRAFEALAGRRAAGLWLPECAYDPRFDADLAQAGVPVTVLDAHGLELARPRPPLGVRAPILGPSGVAFFGRDPEASRDVWSRREGYPGDPWYREFYRDIGFDLPVEDLDGEVGPFGARVMTGLKYHRITGGTGEKAPYDRAAALDRVREHAADFTRRRAAALAASAPAHAPIVVAPYDAELFGHWWFEGPEFLEAVLRELDPAKGGEIRAVTIGAYLARHPDSFVAEPASSSWGEGGFGEVWAGPAVAALWRHVHHAERQVIAALGRSRRATGLPGRALDQAIREVLLLQASDWAFMRSRGEMVEYAERRVRAHVARASRLAALASASEVTAEDASWISAVCAQDRFLSELTGEAIRDAFDPWSG